MLWLMVMHLTHGDRELSIVLTDNFYYLQHVMASLVAQIVKNLPAMQKTRVRSLGWEDPLEKGMATHSSILAWRIPCTDHGVTKNWTQLSNNTSTFIQNVKKTFCPNGTIIIFLEDKILTSGWAAADLKNQI